jgi:acyl carrier protein
MQGRTIEELKLLLAGQLDVNLQLDEIDEDAALLEDGLNLDSLAIVELITLIEDRFKIEFGEEDLNMEAFANLRTLAGVIAAHRARKGGIELRAVGATASAG